MSWIRLGPPLLPPLPPISISTTTTTTTYHRNRNDDDDDNDNDSTTHNAGVQEAWPHASGWRLDGLRVSECVKGRVEGPDGRMERINEHTQGNAPQWLMHIFTCPTSLWVRCGTYPAQLHWKFIKRYIHSQALEWQCCRLAL